MDMFVLKGGRPLRGTLSVSGSKNAALPIMAGALSATGPVVLDGVPDLADVATLSLVLRSLGLHVERMTGGALSLHVIDPRPTLAHYDLVRRMRASVCVLGPLLASRGKAVVSLPGGCNIGHRPIDLHLKGLAALGAEIAIDRGYVRASASGLRGATVDLAGPFGTTVTGTCNVLCAAVLARGQTVITSAASEPEVVDLGHFLQALGARIDGLGTSTLVIEGVEQLGSCRYTIIPDRIEAATLLIAGAITGGDLELTNVEPAHLTAVRELLTRMNVEVSSPAAGALRVRRAGALRAVDVIAQPYPAVPTDVQAQLTALLTLADGASQVTDRVFPDRFLHLPELARLGANVYREGATARIQGVERLCGAEVMASDLRASAALLLAGLAAEGPTTLRRVYHLDRGYERLERKLNAVGARIERVSDATHRAVPAPHFVGETAPVREAAPVREPLR